MVLAMFSAWEISDFLKTCLRSNLANGLKTNYSNRFLGSDDSCLLGLIGIDVHVWPRLLLERSSRDLTTRRLFILSNMKLDWLLLLTTWEVLISRKLTVAASGHR